MQINVKHEQSSWKLKEFKYERKTFKRLLFCVLATEGFISGRNIAVEKSSVLLKVCKRFFVYRRIPQGVRD